MLPRAASRLRHDSRTLAVNGHDALLGLLAGAEAALGDTLGLLGAIALAPFLALDALGAAADWLGFGGGRDRAGGFGGALLGALAWARALGGGGRVLALGFSSRIGVSSVASASSPASGALLERRGGLGARLDAPSGVASPRSAPGARKRSLRLLAERASAKVRASSPASLEDSAARLSQLNAAAASPLALKTAAVSSSETTVSESPGWGVGISAT